ncbi:MAG: Nif3-like dinuclear metal center hexameric protein [Sediminibacterium sp.]
MQIIAFIKSLEDWAPLQFQESYDNAGLIVGDPEANCTGVLCSLDCTEAVVEEAIDKGCNLIVSHHPIIFKGIKQFSSDHYVNRTVLKAIQHNIALYAIHTNLDNVIHGVNSTLADRLHLENRKILAPIPGLFDINGQAVGAGMVGELPLETEPEAFLRWVKEKLNLNVIKHTKLIDKKLITIALCGGSGSFLLDQIKSQKIDCFITSDLKYHDFFEADGKYLLLDIGHGESEHFVPALIVDYLKRKFLTFAVLESEVKTQPISYLK